MFNADRSLVHRFVILDDGSNWLHPRYSDHLHVMTNIARVRDLLGMLTCKHCGYLVDVRLDCSHQAKQRSMFYLPSILLGTN